jgi:hypothetical protein
MSRRNQTIALGALLAILGVTLYFRFRTSDDNAKTFSATGLFTPINVDNPALRLDVLQRFLSLQYKGSHRNIFVATLPPPPPTPVTPVSLTPAVPAGPPPLNVEAK